MWISHNIINTDRRNPGGVCVCVSTGSEQARSLCDVGGSNYYKYYVMQVVSDWVLWFIYCSKLFHLDLDYVTFRVKQLLRIRSNRGGWSNPRKATLWKLFASRVNLLRHNQITILGKQINMLLPHCRILGLKWHFHSLTTAFHGLNI